MCEDWHLCHFSMMRAHVYCLKKNITIFVCLFVDCLTFFPIFSVCLFNRPTFKTATPTSRTQLKQQLQREQLQELERQDLERREAEKKQQKAQQASSNANTNTNALKVPLQSIGVDVPPQVLQVGFESDILFTYSNSHRTCRICARLLG